VSVRREEENYIEAVYKAGAFGYMVCQTLNPNPEEAMNNLEESTLPSDLTKASPIILPGSSRW